MRINVLEEQKTYLLPFNIGSKFHINRDFISKQDINYILFDDIDEQFKKIIDNPKDYIKGLDSYVKSLSHLCSHGKTKRFLDDFFQAYPDTILIFGQ